MRRPEVSKVVRAVAERSEVARTAAATKGAEKRSPGRGPGPVQRDAANDKTF